MTIPCQACQEPLDLSTSADLYRVGVICENCGERFVLMRWPERAAGISVSGASGVKINNSGTITGGSVVIDGKRVR